MMPVQTCRLLQARRFAFVLLLAGLAHVPAFATGVEPTRLLRFPDVHGDEVVFTYAGDLWLASTAGGTARRLTSAPGLELMAKFSPDGKWIAFTGQYGGDEQVYVIPTAGGIPRQLTFYPAAGPLPPRWGYDDLVYGWTADGRAVLFRSLRDTHTLEDGRLYTVPIDGGLPVALEMPTAGAGDFSPDGRAIAYSPKWRDFRTWKHYRGGWATDLYIFDLASHRAQRITDSAHTDRDPMWIGDAIYFASDRDGRLNLYRYDVGSGATRPVTQEREFDVRWPSADAAGQIVYELDGRLHLYDTRSNEDRALDIFVPDDGVARRPQQVRVTDQLESVELSPAGERAVVVARGDVFTLPLEHGVTRNLTRSSGSHERAASWSADGRRIVYVSDASGEEEIWIADQDGVASPRQITRGDATRWSAPRLSPDGSRVAAQDQNGRLFVIDVKSGRRTQIADDPFEPTLDQRWSADGRFLAYSLSDANGMHGVWIWRASDGAKVRATPELFEARAPAWSPDGELLYYLSFRTYPPQIGAREFNFVADRNIGIFAVGLRAGGKNPWGARNDEVGAAQREAREEKHAEEAESEPKPPPEVRIDFEGLAARAIRVPVDADNISRVEVTSKGVVYERDDAFYYGRDPAAKPAVIAFDSKSREPKTLADGVTNWSLSEDGERLLWRDTDGAFKFLDLSQPPDPEKATAVATDGLVVDRRPVEEWAEIFREVWRRYRDYFYVANMHGYDWQAIRARYEPLLAWVADRTDLNYVLGEMISELNVSHAYVEGGDLGLPQRPAVALAGARFELDAASNRYRIARILPGENEEPEFRSPLTEVGSQVNAGDFLLAINGHELTGDENPWRYMQAPAGQAVEWRVGPQADGKGARSVVFEPLASEDNLLYLAWVTANRARVEKLSQGRIAYIHLPDMGSDGIREFVKWWYPLLDHDAMLIDDRSNGGGNVSQMIIERLSRKLLGTDFARNYDRPLSYPLAVLPGPKAVLINGTSASDGDIFPYMFRAAGLGKLIGERTWGGVVGITDRGPLLDGGVVYVPEFGTAGPDGHWIIEGEGVSPDIEVAQDPTAVIEGRDPQLERGVEHLLEALQTQPHGLPPRAPAPVKAQ